MKNSIIISIVVLSLLILGGCSEEKVEEQSEVPKICTADWSPVCGVDGVTYANTCMAEGVDVDHEGECDKPSTIESFEIGPELLDCVGVGPQKCMQVNGNLFYSNIESFDFEEGFSYTIKVEKTKRENVPADASTFNYKLVEILSKSHVCSAEEKENMICTREYMPVCGNDGKTYATGCTACSEGIDSWTEGEC